MIFPAPGRNQMIVFSPDRPEIAMVPIDQPTESRFAVVDGNVICFRAGGTFIAHLSDLRFRQVGMGFEIVNRIDRSNNYGLITVNDNAEMTGISLGPMPGGPGRGR
jgi:hypothetical protein